MEVNSYILDAIDVVIDSKLKELDFNKTLEGVVREVHDDGCDIDINGSTIYANKLSGMEYEIGDVVIVLVLNNNYSNKIILGRR